MKVLITGCEGFIAKNLSVRLTELQEFAVIGFSRHRADDQLAAMLQDVDVVVHLAGVNRPPLPEAFIAGNVGLTQQLCQGLLQLGRAIPVIFASSTQAALDNPYGQSKLAAEAVLKAYAAQSGANVYIYRLPNVFGKWCKPNYNSAIATFCHNLARNMPIQINDRAAQLTLVYIDDVVSEFIRVLTQRPAVDPAVFCTVPVQYQTTVGEVVQQLEAFRESRDTLTSEKVGVGLVRALYATYISYLPTDIFSYEVPQFADPRGVFVEMLKTKDSGQFSYFTAYPGVTRGGHYHHSKIEKFLVIKGKARFCFRHILTDETYELYTSGDTPRIVKTIPGWSHDVTNVGEDELIVMLWANEVFDRDRPDTIASKV